jgi:arginine decarboxylase-like protein
LEIGGKAMVLRAEYIREMLNRILLFVECHRQEIKELVERIAQRYFINHAKFSELSTMGI